MSLTEKIRGIERLVLPAFFYVSIFLRA